MGVGDKMSGGVAFPVEYSPGYERRGAGGGAGDRIMTPFRRVCGCVVFVCKGNIFRVRCW